MVISSRLPFGMPSFSSLSACIGFRIKSSNNRLAPSTPSSRRSRLQFWYFPFRRVLGALCARIILFRRFQILWLGLFVDNFRVEHALGNHFPVSSGALAKKAALVAFVAGSAADLVDLQQERVVVAIDKRVLDFLKISRLLAFEPRAFAGAAVIMRLAGFLGFFPRFLVHVGDHQHFTRLMVLHDHRHQAVPFGKIDTYL